MKTPYIKPTRKVHDSGFRMFEVGYCEMKNAKVVNKRVIGLCSDHIHTDYGVLTGNEPFPISMDLTKDGYIRFWSSQGELAWFPEDFAISSMELVLKEKK